MAWALGRDMAGEYSQNKLMATSTSGTRREGRAALVAEGVGRRGAECTLGDRWKLVGIHWIKQKPSAYCTSMR